MLFAEFRNGILRGEAFEVGCNYAKIIYEYQSM